MQDTRTPPIIQEKNDTDRIEFRRVRALSELDESDAVRLLSIIAPNPDEFGAMWTGDRTPTLFAEFMDPSGNRRWNVLRNVDPRDALSAHVDAGRTQEPVRVEGETHPIRAVGLRYARNSRVSYFSIDLDGKYAPIDVLRKLTEVFGAASLLPHSGSGAEGRYRVLGRLSEPMTVERMQAHLSVIAIAIGFPPRSGHLEISPGNRPSRLPFGCGGCRVFSSELDPVGDPDFDAAVSAFLNLVPIDLESVAENWSNSGIDTGRVDATGKFDPWTRRERPRSRPRRIRRLLAEGIRGPGERNRAIYEFVRDALYSGYTCAQAIARLIAWIEAGKLDPSRDIRRHGRAWQIRQVERVVVRIYATQAALGVPDPIPLSSEEIRDVKKIARGVASRSCFTRERVERFLFRVLPHFKGMRAAGLPMLRMHSKKWEAFDRDYRVLRDLCGLFKATTGHRSLSSVRARRSLGARDSEAHARSYSCSFKFRVSIEDASSPALVSNDPSTSIDTHDIPIDHNNVFVVKAPSSIDLSSSTSTTTTRTNQLYVRHEANSYVSSGSDSDVSESKSENRSNGRPPRKTKSTAKSSDARLQRRTRPVKSPEPVFTTDNPIGRPKPKEWQIVRRWTLPCKPDMGLDEWLMADEAIHKEYARELAEAKADQKHIERTQGVRLSLGMVASKRFHELRALFGLPSWKN